MRNLPLTDANWIKENMTFKIEYQAGYKTGSSIKCRLDFPNLEVAKYSKLSIQDLNDILNGTRQIKTGDIIIFKYENEYFKFNISNCASDSDSLKSIFTNAMMKNDLFDARFNSILYCISDITISCNINIYIDNPYEDIIAYYKQHSLAKILQKYFDLDSLNEITRCMFINYIKGQKKVTNNKFDYVKENCYSYIIANDDYTNEETIWDFIENNITVYYSNEYTRFIESNIGQLKIKYLLLESKYFSGISSVQYLRFKGSKVNEFDGFEIGLGLVDDDYNSNLEFSFTFI